MSDNALDQSIQLNNDDLALLATVDDIVRRAREAGNPDIAFKEGYAFRRRGHGTALAVAKLLYDLKEWWENFATDMSFYDAVFNGIGYARVTVDDYLGAWEEVVLKCPEKYRRQIMGKSLNTMKLLTAASREGQLTDEDWEEVAGAHDKSGVQDIVRRVRGTNTSAGSRIVLTWERDGNLYARRGNSDPAHLGFLHQTSDDELVNIAIERLIRAAGVIKR